MPCISQWRDMWHQFGRSAPDAVFQDLMDRYSEPHRRYHTIQHLDECLAKLCEIKPVALRPREIEFALWFHDAIYDVKRQDNEQRSAERARSTLLDAGLIATAERVHALIMVTRHDAVPKNIDERVLVDVDLSILGANVDRFDEYERQVREEYAWIPGSLFRVKRRKILVRFLERPRIFNTDEFFNKYEAQARANLQRSIERLGG